MTAHLADSLWIIVIGAMVAAACSLVGSFLVLRRMAMLGDAISHAVLPGIAIAFIVTKSRGSLVMLIGAGLVGLLTAFLVQVLSRNGQVRNDAAIGVTFTSLFALGVILISRYAYMVDLDLDCVLYGVIEFTPYYTLSAFGRDWGPQAFWQIALVFAVCGGVISLFFKELKIAAFDPEMATAVGINATVMHYLLMTLVSVTTVGSFEPVGAILVVAMMVVPPSTAYLLTDDVKKMVWTAMGCGVLSAVLGFFLAQWLNASTAGCMTVVAGALFTLALFFSPRHGILTKLKHQRNLARDVAREDLLQALWREHESATPARKPLDALGLAALTQSDIGLAQRTLRALQKAGLVQADGGGFALTAAGIKSAQELVHRHRVYESLLGELGYPDDHVHAAADRVEHFLSPNLAEAVDSLAGNPTTDPHGKVIPHDEDEVRNK